MSEKQQVPLDATLQPKDRRGFFYVIFGGLIAALAGWVSGATSSRTADSQETQPTAPPSEGRLAALEAEVARLGEALLRAGAAEPLAQLEGEFNERVTFNKKELTVANPEGVLVNLVATRGHVGVRFYKDFGFGNETVDSPWSLYIEGVEGYQGLAFLRDWRFTAALWDEDGRLTLGRLDPYPPGNPPARARVHVRGTVDEVQSMVEASPDQTADIFQVIGPQGNAFLAVSGSGDVVVGSGEGPRAVILYDGVDGNAYALKVTNGQLSFARA